MSLNKVMLIGNVGNDPEVRYLESNPQNPAANVKVASFRLATTERYRDRNGEQRENTEWHSVVVWRGNADVVERFVRKGSQGYIEGKLRTRQWTDQTGATRYTTEVVADNLQLLGKRPDAPQPQGAAQPQAGYQSGYQGGYSQPAQPARQQAAVTGPAISPTTISPADFATPASAPVTPAAPSSAAPAAYPESQPSAQTPAPADYQGPLPAAEPSDDLPF